MICEPSNGQNEYPIEKERKNTEVEVRSDAGAVEHARNIARQRHRMRVLRHLPADHVMSFIDASTM